MIKNQFLYKLKAIQTHLGGEFWPFTQYLNQHGVIHHLMCPHTHHQNGLVKRKHWHVMEIGLTLCAQATLKLSY